MPTPRLGPASPPSASPPDTDLALPAASRPGPASGLLILIYLSWRACSPLQSRRGSAISKPEIVHLGYNGNKEMLGKCEQFFLELMKVPRVEAKLRVFAFRITFSTQVECIIRYCL
ncbi:hypothetical protein U9M48_004558 [Paspalum notatum var. saurae]|uniref:FH2 domain-containing protein n=1 Tax=Paspalum notatum var. saurae TaxID=547442 RepID=A0AAQ3SEY0_PASNO